jgi:hypothetical protein
VVVLDITTGGRSRQTPYTRIDKDLQRYITPEHLPGKNFKITDPRNMSRAAILSFFRHICQRQQTHDLKEVFRIRHAHRGRKKTLSNGCESSNARDADSADGAVGASADLENLLNTGNAGGTTEPSVPTAKGGPKRPEKFKTKSKVKSSHAAGRGDMSDHPQVPHPKAKGKQKKSQKTLQVDLFQAAASDTDPQASGIGDQRPRPKPKPRGKKPKTAPPLSVPVEATFTPVGHPGIGNQANSADAVGAVARPHNGNQAHSAAAVGAGDPPVSAMPPISSRKGQTITDDLIDPTLLVGTSGRPQINTADNLALIEARRYMTTGKRVSKKRTQERT